MTWRRVVINGFRSCGSCARPIAKGELVAFTRTGAERCEDCGRKIEDPPAEVDDDSGVVEESVPAGGTHQPSLGFERNRMVATGELARRHVADHFHRRRGAR